MGARYIDGGFWTGDKVEAHVGEWTVTLDTYTVSTGDTYVTHTRIRAPYVNMDGFRFAIDRKSLFSGLGKLLGMQDIQTGDPEFDREYIIKSNNEAKTIAPFSNEDIRRHIQAQPSVHLELQGDNGWVGRSSPEGIDEFCFQIPGMIKARFLRN